MSYDFLFEHFATLATAPDGIARLRELILQLAVQGKLGTQDAGDEPVKILKCKGKSSDNRSSLQNPFNIPKNWIWITIPSLVGLDGLFVDGDWIESKDQDPEGSVRLVQLSDIGEGDFRDHSNRYLTKERAIQLKCTFLEKGDILISRLGVPIGKSCIFPGDLKESITAVDICIVRVDPDKADNKLLVNFFNSHYFKNQIEKYKTGTTRMRISRSNLGLIQFPLPPLAEQHRIVAKVDRLIALCDDLDAQQQQERAGCLKLGTMSLVGLQNADSPEEFERIWAQVCDAFDLILDCPENVAVLRQTILQLAVQGKLGTQEPGDEPAEKLVERIRNEKLGDFKKNHHDEVKNEIKTPYKLPTKWEWVKLDQICNQITDGTHFTPTYLQNGIPFLSVKDVSQGKINFCNTRFISQEEHTELSRRCKPEFEDILFTKVGTTGIARVIDVKKEFSIFVSLALIKIPKHSIFPYYLELALNSPVVKEQSEKNTQGVGNKNLVLKSIKTFDIPLPPLAEQHRIVAKVDEMMVLCDELEARLKERAVVQRKFADVIKNISIG